MDKDIPATSCPGISRSKRITEIGIDQIRPFRDYPFKIRDDDEMHGLVESILINGISTPVIVRKTGKCEYEMISGHRRLFAAEQIGLDKMPAVVRRYSDDEAVMEMVDSGLQRENLSLSEKAFAYKMRYEAMRREEDRSRPYAGRSKRKEWTDVKCAREVGISRNQLHRFLNLTKVIPPILDLVDREAVALATAVEISYLDPKVQEMIYRYMQENDICKCFQIYAVREYFKYNDSVTKMELIRILNENAPINTNNTFQRIILTREKLKEFFPVFYTKSQMENVIFKLLTDWKAENETQ